MLPLMRALKRNEQQFVNGLLAILGITLPFVVISCGPLPHRVYEKPGQELLSEEAHVSYHFDSERLRCVDEKGNPGYNKESDGPCVDLHGQTITSLNSGNSGNGTSIDLSGADLRGATIASDVSLNGANLEGADLENLTYQNGDLTGANLSHADLRGANLTGTDLSKTNLSDVNTTNAVMPTPDPSPSPSP
jgi:hypothetical protein